MAKALETAFKAVVTVGLSLFVASLTPFFTLGSTALQILALTGAGAFVTALLSKPLENPTVDNFGSKVSNINPIAPRQIVYGQTKVGGTIVYAKSNGTDNAYLNIIVAIAGHEIQSIEKIFINKKEVTATSATENSTTVFTVTNSDFVNTENTNAFASGRLIKYVFGLGADNQEMNGFTIANTDFTADHDLKGIAFVHFKMTFDQAKLTQLPEINFEIKGKKIFDPRTSQTAFSNNPALIVRDILTDTRYGLKAISSNDSLNEINDNTSALGNFVAAANACEVQVADSSGTDHNKYTANGFFNASTSVSESLQGVLSACAGKVTYVNGQFNIFVGTTQTPSLTITKDDLVEEINVTNATALGKQYNHVKPIFVDASNKFVATDSPIRNTGKNSSGSTENYLTTDTPTGETASNYKKEIEIQMPFVTNDSQAQRLGQLSLNYQRRTKIIEVATNLKFLELVPGNWVYVTNERLNFDVKPFEVLTVTTQAGTAENPSLFCKLVLKEIDNNVFAFDTSNDYISTTTGSISDDGVVIISPPTLASDGLSQGNTNDNGTIKSHVDVTWTNASSSSIFQTEIQWRVGGTFGTPTSSAIVEPDQTTFRIENAVRGAQYYVRVRHKSASTISSAFSTVRNITIAGDTTAPSVPTSLSASTGLPSTIKVSWTNPSDTDLRSVKVYRKTVDSNPTDDSTVIATISGEPSKTSTIFTGVDDGLVYGTNYFFWVRAVDYSGNESALSSSVSGNFVRIRDDDFQGVGGGIFFFNQAGNNNAPDDTAFNTQEGRKPRNEDIVISRNTTDNESVSYKYTGQTPNSEGGGGSFSSTGILLTGDLVGLAGEGVQDILSNTTTGNQGSITFNKHTTKLTTFPNYEASSNNLPQLILFNQRKVGATLDTGLNAGSVKFSTNLRDSGTGANLATEQDIAGMFIDMTSRTAGFGLGSANPSAKIKFKVVQAPTTSGGSYNLVDLLTLDRHNGSQLDSSLNIDDADSNGYLHIGDTTVIDASKAFKNVLIADHTPSSTTNRLYQNSGTLFWNGNQVGVGAINAVTNMSDNRVITASGSNSLNGEANLTFNGTTLALTGNQTISGNLTVSGTTTTIDTTNLDVKDKNITLNFGSGDTSSNADGAGITIQDAVDASTDATILWNASADRFDFSHGLRINADNQVLTVGAGGDFSLSHNGTDTFMANNTGHFYITTTSDDKDIIFRTDDGSGNVTSYFRVDGGTENVIYQKNLKLQDNVQAQFGTGEDLKIYHDGSHSYIQDSGTGRLRFQASTQIDFLNGAGTETLANFIENDAVKLYFNNALKLATTSSGIDVTGAMTASGTVSITTDGNTSRQIRFVDANSTSSSSFIAHDNGVMTISSNNNTGTGSIVFSKFNTSGSFESGRFDTAGNFQMGTTPTTVIDSSRNLTNIGTISSGAITSSGVIESAVTGNAKLIADGSTHANVEIDRGSTSSHNNLLYRTAGAVKWRIWQDGADNILKVRNEVAGTNVLTFTDTNATFAGNIEASLIKATDQFQSISGSRTLVMNANFSGLGAIGMSSNDHLTFVTNNTERMRLDNSGRLGIGTNAPSQPLQINTGGTSGGMQITSTDADAFIHFNETSDNKGFFISLDGNNNSGSNHSLSFFSQDGGSNVNRMMITNDGKIGIGTSSPSRPLHIKNSDDVVAFFECTDATSVIHIKDQNTGVSIGSDSSGNGIFSADIDSVGSKNILFKLAGSEKVRLTSSGNLGVGTSSPATKLEVAGNITLPSDGQIKFRGTNHYPRIFASSNNLLVNVDNGSGTNFTALTIDNGGTTTLKGGTADTSDHTLIVRNSSSTALFSIRNDGRIDVGGSQLLDSSRNFSNIGTITQTTNGEILDSSANLTNINNVYASGYRIGSTTVIDSSRNLTNIGTISSGTITSSGNIDVNSDSGQLQFGADNDMQMFHNGAIGEINIATGDFLVDSVGDITLDAAGNDWNFNSQGGNKLKITNASGDVVLAVGQQDKDLIFKGNDGGSTITALTLDMSAGGNATFAGTLTVPGNVEFFDETADAHHSLTLQKRFNKETAIKWARGSDVDAQIRVGDSENLFIDYNHSNTGDSVIFRNNSSEVARIDNSARLGIGTNAPTSRLTVKSSSTSSQDSAITVQGNANTNAIFKVGEKSADGGRLHMFDGGVEKIAFYTDGTANHISAGFLGLGTSSADQKLHVDGNIKLTGSLISDNTTIIDSSRNMSNLGTISNTGRHLIQGGNLQMNNGDNSHRYYYVATSSGGGDFLLGQIEFNDGADGAIEGTVCFAYDYGTTSESPKIHFSFAQRNGTARGSWWYEHDDDAAGSNNVKLVLIDDGSGGMFVWLRVGDFARLSLNVIIRQGGNWTNSGTLSSGTITTGTTLFDTSNDPTSEHHIGKLFAHGDSEIEGQLTIGSGNNIVNAGNMTIDVAGDLTLDVDGQDILFKDGGTQFGSIRKNGNNLQLMASIQDGDITFHGNDGGSAITALTLDMSAGGNATFAGSVTATSLSVSSAFSTTANINISGTSGKYQINSLDVIEYSGGFRVGSVADDDESLTLVGFGGQPNIVLDDSVIQFKFSTSEKMRLDSSGRVGIATSSPSEKLHINGSSSEVALRIDTTNADPKIRLTTLGQQDWSIGVDYSDSGKFKINESGTVGTLTALTIDPSRVVGIGNSSPASFWSQANSLVLDASGNTGMTIKSTSSGNGRIVFTDQSSSNPGFTDGGQIHYGHSADDMRFRTAGADRVTIDSSGRLGIGTTSPAYLLHVSGADNTLAQLRNTNGSSGQCRLQFNRDSAIRWNIGVNLSNHFTFFDQVASTAPVRIEQGAGNNTLTVDSQSRVGIGTNAPSQTLDVAGNIQATGSRLISAAFDSNHYMRLEGNSSGGVLKGADGGVVTTLVRSYGDSYFNSGGGNFGIGTSSPSSLLHLNSGNRDLNFILADSPSTGNVGVQLRAGASDFIGLAGGGGTGIGLVVDSSNKVGIGTTSPNFLLDVEGTGSTLARLNSTSGAALLQISVPDTTSICDINFGDSGATSRGQIRYRHNSDSLAISTAATEALRIDNSQRVGIGTSSPADKLHVNGDFRTVGSTYAIRLAPSSGAGPILQFGTTSDTDAYGTIAQQASQFKFTTFSRDFNFNNNGTTNLYIDVSEVAVGINTSSPTSKLNIDTGSDQGIAIFRTGTNANFDAIQFRKSNNSDLNARIGFNDTQLRLDGVNDILFGIGSSFTEKMRLNSTGLGIGTSSPSDKVEVYANGADVALRIHEDAGTHTARLHLREGTQDTHIQNRANNGFEIRTENNISTSNTAALSIAGTGVASFGYDVQMGGTTIIDSSRNLTNIGTISSGAITSSGVIESAVTGNAKLIADGSTHANVEIDRGSTSSHNNLLYRTAGAVKWRIWQDGADNILKVRNEVAGTNVLTFTDTNATFAGNIEGSLIKATDQFQSISGSRTLVMNANFSGLGAIGMSSNDHLTFVTNNTERMRLDNSGRLGIGTTSPAEKLHVEGNIRLEDNFIDFKSSGDATKLQFKGVRADTTTLSARAFTDEGGFSYTTFADEASDAPTGATNNANGVITMNTHGGAYVHQLAMTSSGNMYHRYNNGGSLSSWSKFHKGGALTDITSLTMSGDLAVNTDSLFVDVSADRVGIGTSSPTENLHVIGNILTSGGVKVGDSSADALHFFGILKQGSGSGTTVMDSSRNLTNIGTIATTDFTTATTAVTVQNKNLTVLNQPLNISSVNNGRLKFFQTTSGASVTKGSIQWFSSGNFASAAIRVVGDGADDNSGKMEFYVTSQSDEVTNPFDLAKPLILTDDTVQVNQSTLFVGKTAQNTATTGIEARNGGFFSATRANAIVAVFNRTTSDGALIAFRRNNTTVGSVSVTTSATTYNTTSDARLKDVTGYARGLKVINQLNPVAFNWKADGKADEGLIAQEVEKIVPNAVNKEDDLYQMDYSKLVVHLIKAVQEQQEEIEKLKEEVKLYKRN